ncbi:ABC transporter permease [Devosia epidermidihirudinis]|uniref:ABC transporter permease n=1 Tax=Devosia epidermidihirudinis TaxID=1293439 RepID=A0A0F5QGL4_9HYPH|nr:ABC transporter permease [Devosia epidermidihirudinis]KKC39853.1 ABC transporter permease [Devosia epidermidihirudinis]
MSIADTAVPTHRPRWLALDKLGVMIALIAIAGAALPFALFRANRIVPGETRSLLDALPTFQSTLLIIFLLVGFVAALLRVPVRAKLAVGFVVLAALFILVGQSATYLTPPDNTFARVSPGAGFWLLVFAFALLVTDALTRLRFAPLVRIGILIVVAAAFALLLWSGSWNDLSMLKEYATRAPAFWAEARTHLALAFGSVAIAVVIGVPIGVLCYKVRPLRAAVLNTLNIVQTIPSIALFGLLIAPLAWVAANVPGASAIGISGIGAAPALVALFAYSLLPVVSNTVVGLQSVSPAAVDAAKGMGMTGWQRLAGVELPLAFPVILTGIRIVLVQNIGLATIAALIGGGGFGVFVFQGIGQTAMDLVLLGAVPTVALAFAAAVVLDALVEMTSRGGRRV